MSAKIGARWCLAMMVAVPAFQAGCNGQIGDGYGPLGTGSGSGGAIPSGSGGTGGGTPDPFGVASTCTSNMTWLGGNEGNADMNPGMACISCHATTGGEAPSYTIAGTVYPTGHEPDGCYGAQGNSGVQVVITGADGNTLTLKPSAAGNFYSSMPVAMPYQAKVLYMGRERDMLETQSTGDCNSCHTQSGASLAPGRIVLP
jgi:hypothetical protein